MENQSYYRIVDTVGCNQHIDEEPLVVNCAGYCLMEKPFHTCSRDGREDYYLQFLLEGHLRIRTGEGEELMEQGMFLLTRPHASYEYSLDSGSMGYLWIHFTGFHAGRLLTRLGLETGRLYRMGDTDADIPGLFSLLFEEFNTRQRGFDDVCAAHLTRILASLSRGAAAGDTAGERKLATIAWIHCHFTENVPIGDLAAMEHLSESRYRSVFRRQTGISPSEYRIALRMQHACDLLLTSDASITDISTSCGYGDVLYFTRLFKQKTGLPPGEYRARGRVGAAPVREEEKV